MIIKGLKTFGRFAALAAVLAAGGCSSRQPSLGDLTAEELWVRGIEEYNAGDWQDAIRYFERYVLVGGSDPRVHQARFYVAQAHFERKEYVTAATEASRLAGDLGRTELADDARMIACRAYDELSPRPERDQEYTRAAIEHCQSLLDYFPDSEHARRAREIVDAMWGKLARKAYDNGEWYLRRRAYDSAIIYFEDVVARFPQTDFAPRALARLVEIYGRLQYDEEREEARQRLLANYPESPEARRLGGGAG